MISAPRKPRCIASAEWLPDGSWWPPEGPGEPGDDRWRPSVGNIVDSKLTVDLGYGKRAYIKTLMI